MNDVVVAALDVGSPEKIGWWRDAHGVTNCGTDLNGIAEAIADDLDGGSRVALGFEAPLFIPRLETLDRLNKSRNGEGNRSWSGFAGPIVLSQGLQQTTYVLSRIAGLIQVRPIVTFEPSRLIDGSADLLIWEAFVSGKSKNREAAEVHVDDARLAVNEFRTRLETGNVTSDIVEPVVQNLVASALIIAGLLDDLEMFKYPCVVIKPPDYKALAT